MTSYIFGFGSLMNKLSAEKALKRTLGDDDLKLTKLNGYERKWTLKEKVYSQQLGKIIDAVFLDIEPHLAKSVNGVLIEVTEIEINRLKQREKNYHFVEVTSGIVANLPSKSNVYTFVAKNEYKAKQDDDVYVMEGYTKIMKYACEEYGDQFSKEYEESTYHHNFRVISGEYQFVDIQQANFV